MIYILPTDTCLGIGCSTKNIDAYKKIYTIKKRSLTKPLSIMVAGFEDLEKYSNLTGEQIDFLKKYEKPFTVLARSNILEHRELPNKEVYTKVGFRVAHFDVQKKLIEQIGPIFLTSANISGEKECYTFADIWEIFGQDTRMTFIGSETEIGGLPPSDIFAFVGESVEQKFLRR